MVPKQADSYLPCPECASLTAREGVEHEHFAKVHVLKSHDELAAMHPVNTDLRHDMNEDDVLATYKFVDPARCSMPRQHKHWEGWVMQTLCGLTINLGRQCGGDLVAGFARMEKFVDGSRSYHQFIPAMTTLLRELRERFAEVKIRQTGIFKTRALIAEDLPMFASTMRKKLSNRGRLLAEQIPPGIELWNYDIHDLAAHSSELRGLGFELDGAAEKPLGRTEQAAYRKRMDRLQSAVAQIDQWIDVASRFLTIAGIARAAEIYDSDWVRHHTTKLNPLTGEHKDAFEDRFERTRTTLRVSQNGITNDQTGNVTRIEWIA